MLPDGTFLPLGRFLLPTTLLVAAGLLVVTSLFLPYWGMTLHAPQYPQGLHVTVRLTGMSGDVAEIDELNHYLGLSPIENGGRLERAVAPWAVPAMAGLLGLASWVYDRRAALLTVPALAFPAGFAADLWTLLDRFGHSIDPHSALGGAVEPFTPTMVGHGAIGQFTTDAQFGVGFWFAVLASVLGAVGLWAHRRAFKPLADAQRPVEVSLGVETSAGGEATGEAIRR